MYILVYYTAVSGVISTGITDLDANPIYFFLILRNLLFHSGIKPECQWKKHSSKVSGEQLISGCLDSCFFQL